MKNWRPNGKEITNINNTNDLQKEINDVLNVCKEIITSNNSFMKQNASKIKSIKPMKSEDKSSEITLEKVLKINFCYLTLPYFYFILNR